MPQTTIVSLFQYKGFRNKLQALGRMGRPPVAGKKIDGLTFWKPFGTGSGKGSGESVEKVVEGELLWW